LRAESILSGVREAAKAAGVTCETLHVNDQFPAEGIIETAKSRGCDLIMMASHGYRGPRSHTNVACRKMILARQGMREGC
jgi:nucleotide-binding universal stress UspA family protein